MKFTLYKEKLKEVLSPKRYDHSLGVQQTAMELAARFGGNIYKAGVAGLLHDCAREMPSDHLLKRAEEFGIVVGSLEYSSPVLLHAAVSACIASKDYGIQDNEILKAITLHTTGGADMSVLDKIIFLADFIEPHRDFSGVDMLRDLARKNLDKAVLAAFDQTMRHLLKKQMVIHPDSVEGRNALLISIHAK